MDAANQDAANAAAGGHEPPQRLGKYELIAKLGSGGMAEVYLARLRGPMNFEKVVVVKKIHPHLASEQQFIDMLLDEARISALLKHPRVVDIYDLGVANGTYFIAMEFLPGQPLTKVITRGRSTEPLDVLSAARLIADAADGLHAAHNLTTISGKHLELVHRDVSPANIIVQYDGGVKLVDFGVARARGRITKSGVNQIKGKIGYVSPEQIENVDVDRRSDLFSLGVVLWETLALRRLYFADTEAAKIKMILDGNPLPPSKFRDGVPPALDAICLKALALDRADRFQSAQDMQHALESLLLAAGYYRESDHIPAFMERTFADERAAQTALLRAVAEAQETLPFGGEDFCEVPGERDVRTTAPLADESHRERFARGEVVRPRRSEAEPRHAAAAQQAMAVMEAYAPRDRKPPPPPGAEQASPAARGASEDASDRAATELDPSEGADDRAATELDPGEGAGDRAATELDPPHAADLGVVVAVTPPVDPVELVGPARRWRKELLLAVAAAVLALAALALLTLRASPAPPPGHVATPAAGEPAPAAIAGDAADGDIRVADPPAPEPLGPWSTQTEPTDTPALLGPLIVDSDGGPGDADSRADANDDEHTDDAPDPDEPAAPPRRSSRSVP